MELQEDTLRAQVSMLISSLFSVGHLASDDGARHVEPDVRVARLRHSTDILFQYVMHQGTAQTFLKFLHKKRDTAINELIEMGYTPTEETKRRTALWRRISVDPEDWRLAERHILALANKRVGMHRTSSDVGRDVRFDAVRDMALIFAHYGMVFPASLFPEVEIGAWEWVTFNITNKELAYNEESHTYTAYSWNIVSRLYNNIVLYAGGPYWRLREFIESQLYLPLE